MRTCRVAAARATRYIAAPMILVIGGTGKVGAQLLEQLSATGAKFRALVRDPSKVKTPGVEAVKGDLADGASVDAALKGVERLFLLTPSLPGTSELQMAAIDRAKAAGVKHVVRLSVFGADPKAGVTLARWHAQTDAHLVASGLKWTLLKPGSFAQNLLASAATIKKDGAFYGCSQDGKTLHIDTRDIAAVAVKALTESGHENQTYTLTGQEPLSYAQVAERIGKVAGKPVKYVDLPPEQFKQGLISAGLPEWLAADYVAMGVGNAKGWAATPDPTVPRLLGRARTLGDFFAAYGGAFR